MGPISDVEKLVAAGQARAAGPGPPAPRRQRSRAGTRSRQIRKRQGEKKGVGKREGMYFDNCWD